MQGAHRAHRQLPSIALMAGPRDINVHRLSKRPQSNHFLGTTICRVTRFERRAEANRNQRVLLDIAESVDITDIRFP